MAAEQSLSSIEDPKSTDSVADQPHGDGSPISETEPESSNKGSKSIEPEKSKDDSPVLEKAKKTVRMQSAMENYSQFPKDLHKDLCFYNNKGTNQGTYELKPEYKRTVEEPDSK